MADGLCRSEVVDRIIEIAEVFVRWAAALGSNKGDGGHDIWSAYGKID